MRAILLLAVLAVGCSGSPTAPTPPPVAVVPPVVVPPVVVPPAFPPNDSRFDLAFFRQFVHGSIDLAGRTVPLRRHDRPPLIYIMTIDNQGNPITAATLDATAAALINTTPMLTGGMGVSGLEYGTVTPLQFTNEPGRISVQWDGATTNSGLCARSNVGGSLITVFLRTPGCTPCLGLQVRPIVIKHELGHALGFWHTDNPNDLMHPGGTNACDRNPSDREAFHAQVAYSLPVGSAAP